MRTLKQIVADTRLYSDYHNEETLVKCVKVWLEEKRQTYKYTKTGVRVRYKQDLIDELLEEFK